LLFLVDKQHEDGAIIFSLAALLVYIQNGTLYGYATTCILFKPNFKPIRGFVFLFAPFSYHFRERGNGKLLVLE